MSDAIGNRTLLDLLEERAALDPTRPWLIFEDRTGAVSEYSYGEFLESAKRVGAGFRQLGVQHGDRVLVHLKNCPEFLLSWFGLAAIGAVIVPSNTANTRSEIEFIAERAGIKGAVSEPQFASVVSGLTETVPGCSFVSIARATEVIPGTIAFETLLSTPPIEPEPGLIRPDDVSQILFTSGTTAKPKGVLVTHANALWSGERALKGMGYRQADRCMTALPLFHVNGQAVTVLGALTAGAAVVILEQFVPGEYLNQLRRHRVTQTSLVATQSKALLSQPSSPADRDHALHTVGHAINITNEEKDLFEERFGVRLINIYGLSEATEIVTFSPLNGPQRWPSIGMPAMDREVRVAAGDGVECAAGDLGEIQVRGIRGKNLMAGYFGDSEATEKTFDGEWLRTGDFGYADAAGYIYFIDRQKDLIKSSGQNVSATEVEDVLNSHPFVVESGVIAVDHATRGEAVKAFVVVAGGDVTAEELKSYCAEILSKYKLPEYIEFIDALPRTSVGKIAKGELRTREAANVSLSVSSGK